VSDIGPMGFLLLFCFNTTKYMYTMTCYMYCNIRKFVTAQRLFGVRRFYGSVLTTVHIVCMKNNDLIDLSVLLYL